MTSKTLRHFAGASISADDLFERFKVACDLKQSVDHNRIEAALHRWASLIDAGPVTVHFVRNAREIDEAAWAAWAARAAGDARAARAARDAWVAWAARDAWAAWAARAAGDARAARAARDAWVAWAARDAWAAWAARAAGDARAARAARDASLDLSWISIAAIGASSEGEESLMQRWLPILEAFEAGAFAMWVGAETFYVAVKPDVVKVDDQRRLHCEDAPAFAWLDDIRDYYWRGVHVPDAWIIDRKSLTPEIALSEQSIERRRAACEILGWDAILHKLGAVSIDRDGDPQIGELVEVKLPGEGGDKITARYLRVQCGTGRKFAVCVPPTVNTAIEAQSWMLGLPSADFTKPEVRT
jgi:hypothetical protein